MATWKEASLVEKRTETPSAATLEFSTDSWPGHRAGQHVDLRLTADDGYQAERSYSIASPPEDSKLALTVERLEEGEVSPYLVDDMQPGDVLELRGPIGGWFVWEPSDGGPLLLIGGGSGVVPLMAMLRHRANLGDTTPARLLLSAKTIDEVFYADELHDLAGRGDGFELRTTLTRGTPPGWEGYHRRVDRDMLAEVSWSPEERPHVFICGPTAFVEAASAGLVGLGHDPGLIRTERFGPTGGPS